MFLSDFYHWKYHCPVGFLSIFFSLFLFQQLLSKQFLSLLKKLAALKSLSHFLLRSDTKIHQCGSFTSVSAFGYILLYRPVFNINHATSPPLQKNSSIFKKKKLPGKPDIITYIVEAEVGPGNTIHLVSSQPHQQSSLYIHSELQIFQNSV